MKGDGGDVGHLVGSAVGSVFATVLGFHDEQSPMQAFYLQDSAA